MTVNLKIWVMMHVLWLHIMQRLAFAIYNKIFQIGIICFIFQQNTSFQCCVFPQNQTVDDKLLVRLKTLNPTNLKTKLKRTILPPNWDYFVQLFLNDSFRKILKTDSTQDEGMNDFAKFYKVEQDWNDYKKTMGCITQG